MSILNLLYHSEELEGSVIRSKQSMESVVDSLDLLDGLGAITQASLTVSAPTPNPPAPAPAPTRVSSAVSPSAPKPPQQPKVQYQTGRQDYQPALANRNLVDALLSFHKQTRSHHRPQSVKTKEAPTQVASSPRPRAPTPPAKVAPRLDDGLKPAKVYHPGRPPQISLPVFRPRRPK